MWVSFCLLFSYDGSSNLLENRVFFSSILNISFFLPIHEALGENSYSLKQPSDMEDLSATHFSIKWNRSPMRKARQVS